MNRMDAINELYALGTEAEKLLASLTEAQEKATTCRLNSWFVQAAMFNTETAMLWIRLGAIAERQKSLIDQLNAAEETIYL